MVDKVSSLNNSIYIGVEEMLYHINNDQSQMVE